MARVTVEDCLESIPCRFALVHLTTCRVKLLKNGAPIKVEANNKDVVMALREIAAKKVSFEAEIDWKTVEKIE